METYKTPQGTTVPEDALTWKFTRSGGPGGQHVNTSSSRVSLTVELGRLDPEVSGTLVETYGDTLTVHVSTERSQHQNRQGALVRIGEKIDEALKEQKERKKTKVPRAVRNKILENKARLSTKKDQRRTDWSRHQ